ncbi:sterol desaturase family protein [Sandarakinorhabdus limnophila]|uniref:sterol desaturase family protein n=1 Tax=Sandarakinorhabdus limnophila TaxID=210512 RepID=UPI0026EFA239|nr:sterol desaturase family protein [Sandarakinorhabdus limnophila]MCM0033222.1 sterol desaturase family protein [Sandarakinorhabdus limnophila]
MTAMEFVRSNIVQFSALAFLAMIAVEQIAIRLFHRRGKTPLKDSGVSIAMGFLSEPANAATAFITLGALAAVEPFQIATIPVTWATFLLCFVLDDLRFYVHHRIAHRVRWVWAMHVVHHSSQNYNLPIALRQSWTKHFTGTMMLKIPLVLVGFDPIMVTFCGVLNATYQFFLHTETIDRMPRWYEAIFNTPSHHRVHHGTNPRYLDANYAGTLIIWDRLFGTFEAERADDPPIYGLVKQLDTLNPVTVLTHEYVGIARDASQRDLRWWQRLAYVFAPPGWSHDGSRETTQSIRAAAGFAPDARRRAGSSAVPAE